MSSCPPGGLPHYRLLTGVDDDEFCKRVSDALGLGWSLHGSPAVTFDGGRVIAAQALLWPKDPPSRARLGAGAGPGSVEIVEASGWHWGVRRWGASQSTRGVLLLHGWPGTSRDWADIAELAAANEGFEVLCPDLIGFGASEKPIADPAKPDPYAVFSPAEHVRRLIGLLDDFGYEQVLIGGYDLGANLAQGLASTLGERVRGLLLCDPVHPAARAEAGKLDLHKELWYQALHLLPWAGELIAHDRQTVEIYLRHFYTHWWGEGEIDSEIFDALVDAYAQPGALEASLGWYRSRRRTSAGHVAEAGDGRPLTLPVEVLWGARDPVTPIALAGSLARSFTDFHLETLEEVGHFAPLEAPGAVAEALQRLIGRARW